MNTKITLENILKARAIANKEDNQLMEIKLQKLFNEFDDEILIDSEVINYMKDKRILSFFTFKDLNTYLGLAFNEKNKELVKKINDLINNFKNNELDLEQVNIKISNDSLLNDFFNRNLSEEFKVEETIEKQTSNINKIENNNTDKQNIKGWTMAS